MVGGMWLWTLIIIGLFTIAIIAVLRNGINSEKNENTPLEIAQKRLAKGEISKEEFEEIKYRL